MIVSIPEYKYIEKFEISDEIISSNSYYIIRDAKMNSRKYDICNVNVHRTPYVKHLKSKKHIENM